MAVTATDVLCQYFFQLMKWSVKISLMQSFYYKPPITCGTIDGVLTKHFFVIQILLILYINVCVVLAHMQVVIEQNRIEQAFTVIVYVQQNCG